MTLFDYDPEDGYDAGDPPGRRLDVIAAVVADLAHVPDDGRHTWRRLDALRVLGDLEQVPGVDLARLHALRVALG